MGIETHSISFVDSFLAALPFTKQGKDAKQKLDEVNQVNDVNFFQQEKERVQEIQLLFENGREKEALRELIGDTNVENPLQYYNQLISRDQGGNVDENKSHDSTNDSEQFQSKQKDEPEGYCQWKGFNRKYCALICTNKFLYHPWKTVTNICGQKERMKINYCAYHQKYCLDERRRHVDKLIKITTPNSKGLCTECHILIYGAPPMDLVRYPGLRRKNKLGEEEKSASMKMSPRKLPKQRERPLKAKGNEGLYQAMTTVDATLRIVRLWRKRKALKAGVQMRVRDRKRNKAAVTIQVCFRYSQLRKRLHIRKEEGSSQETKVDETSNLKTVGTILRVDDSATKAHGDNPSLLTRYKSHIYCQPCSSVTLPELKNAQETQLQQQAKPRRKRRCELPMCRICFPGRRVLGKGRPRISSAHYTGAMLSTDNIDAMSRRFRDLDRFDLGSLPRNDFFQIIRSFYYNKLGQTLLPEEVLSVSSAFECRDGRDGHIDYIKYTAFARKQNHPCRVHSRLVCTICTSRSSCTTSISCTKYVEDPSMPAFCRCGKYKSRHDQVPVNSLTSQTFRRGFHIFTNEDLKRTFDRRIKADTGTQLTSEMQSPEDAMSRPGVQSVSSPSLYCDYPSQNKKKHHRITEKKQKKQVHSPPQSWSSVVEHMLVASPSTDHDKKKRTSTISEESEEKQVQSPLLSNPPFSLHSKASQTFFIEGPLFSTSCLESMMDACVEYRKRPVTPKPSIPCPLCKFSFYENEKLQKHLKTRHSIEEIQYCIQDFNSRMVSSSIPIYPQVKIQWKGKSTIVPPLPPPVPLKICNHHVPPHPRCKTCKVTLKKSALFPPIRFYPGAFVEVRKKEDLDRHPENKPQTLTQDDENEEGGPNITISNFHFSVDDADLAVVVMGKLEGNSKDEKRKYVGKLVAICEDGRRKHFVGLQFYRLASDVVQRQRDNKLKNEDEVVLESDVNWVEMKNVIGRRHIFNCTEREFQDKKLTMGVHQDKMQFCQYKIKGEEIILI